MNQLGLGISITIKRSDGRLHQAIVSSVEYESQSVKVEWCENGETKGKEIHFTNIVALNPQIVISKPTKRENHCESLTTIDEGEAFQTKRFCSLGQERCQSAKSRLTSRKCVDDTTAVNDILVEGKRILSSRGTRSVLENISKFKESATLKKLSKLENNRIERRRRNAEVKAEKDEICRKNQNTPHWELLAMIDQYRSSIKICPLSYNDFIEDHLITVAVRKRPLNNFDLLKKEIDIITIPNKNQLIVHEPKYKVDLTKYLDNHVFTFDYTFNETCSNHIVYKYTAQPLIKTIFEGGYATCFAYGQTGSGKTYLMSGCPDNAKEKGIYALTAADIFKEANSEKHRDLKLEISCSFFEIYVKKVSDLLNGKQTLRILEDGRQQVQVVGLTEKTVSSVNEVLHLIKIGNEERASGQTSANVNSSRSHAVFQICLRSKRNPKKIHGKFSLIDLAGNERGADTFFSSKITKMEGSEINQSLLTLKECIRALGRKGAHLPFRGSKLTQVLRDSFIGANNKTCMIAMVSPGVGSCENSLNTLRYADRVKELGGVEVQGNKSLDHDLQMETNTVVRSSHSLNAYSSQKSFDKPSMEKLEDKIVNAHKDIVKKLQKSAKEAEELLNSTKNDVEKYSLNWNMLIEDVVTSLNKAKM
ncbi:unnamed protein product [Acanthoscelides obtectus]|uniref:Kinesin-like protein n=1 Tax=Acanthoscelides obtectus TaxID=200917 RepID=A0A9P0JWU7_ACAOB|nr:unnamed protein product [Acanthoscelides obtectus]CAK1663406.1 Kinesin-like protein KIF2C [Acanthoscelides obtectus]